MHFLKYVPYQGKHLSGGCGGSGSGLQTSGGKPCSKKTGQRQSRKRESRHCMCNETEFFRLAAAVAAGKAEGGLLTIRHSGPITAADWLTAGRIASESAAAWRAAAMISDLRGAVFLADVGELARVATYPAPTVPLLPAALVVAPAMREAFVDYCWTLAVAGVRRRVFTDLDAARGWARRVVTQQHRRKQLAPCGPPPAAFARRHAASLPA